MWLLGTDNKDLYVPYSIIEDGVKQWLNFLESNGYLDTGVSSKIYNNSIVMRQLKSDIISSETEQYQIQDFTHYNFIICPFDLGNVTIQNERDLQVYQQTLKQLLSINQNIK